MAFSRTCDHCNDTGTIEVNIKFYDRVGEAFDACSLECVQEQLTRKFPGLSAAAEELMQRVAEQKEKEARLRAEEAHSHDD